MKFEIYFGGKDIKLILMKNVVFEVLNVRKINVLGFWF